MRGFVFAKRTAKEILRDPLTFIFCLGFPLVMLVIMTIVNESIPPEAGMKIFQMPYLAPGIVMFGFTFIMLFACLQVSKDRSTAFLVRLYASPMKSGDFIVGYTLPILAIAVLQSIITFVAAIVIGVVVGETLAIGNVLLSVLVSIPSAIMFLSFGLLFGTILNDKAAPGICSILITAASMLGGIWMDVDALGGMLQKICHALPFYQGVSAARMAVLGEYVKLGKPFSITVVYAIAVYLLSVWALKSRMQRDIK